jgi:hypothetical protein
VRREAGHRQLVVRAHGGCPLARRGGAMRSSSATSRRPPRRRADHAPSRGTASSRPSRGRVRPIAPRTP